MPKQPHPIRSPLRGLLKGELRRWDAQTMTFGSQIIVAASLFCVFLAWFLPLRYGRTPETKERHRKQFAIWIGGNSASARVFKIAVALLAIAAIAHVFWKAKQ
jgi:hypothetical protein